LRSEFFNLFNRPQVGLPNAVIGNPTFRPNYINQQWAAHPAVQSKNGILGERSIAHSASMKNKIFQGWIVVAAAVLTFGFSNGIPYYNISFFYDYFQRAFGWSRSEITIGLPLATLATIWAGPLLVPNFSPRKFIMFGTAMTAVAFAGFALMRGSLVVYCAFWVAYMVGFITSGPIPHQIIVSQWFRKKRGTAMGIVYIGVGLLGSIGSLIVKPITEWYGFRFTLVLLAALMFATWPILLWIIKDKPGELGLYPDGEDFP
jgi:MFS family permease